MPLVSAPGTGYADYQRTQSYDTQALWNTTTVLGNTLIIGPVLNIQRFAYLTGFLQAINGYFGCEVRYYIDSAASVTVGVERFAVHNSIASVMQLHLPAMGPFVQVRVFSLDGTQYSAGVVMYGSNRDHPLQMVPMNPVLVNQQSVALGASANATFYPTDYYSGPMRIGMYSSASTVTTSVQLLSQAGTWDYVEQVTETTQALWSSFMTIAPKGAWRLFVVNAGAATSIFSVAIPSSTGAA